MNKPEPSYLNSQRGNPHLWEIRAVRELVFLGLLVFLFWLFYHLSGIVIPLLLAAVLAHIFNPFVTLIETMWHLPRPLIVAFLLGSFIICLFGLISWMLPLLLGQAISFTNNLPEYLHTIATASNLDLGDLSKHLEESIKQFQVEPKQIITQILRTTDQAVSVATAAIGMAAGWTLSLVLLLVFFFFFSWRFNSALEAIKQFVPSSRRLRTIQIVSQMDAAVGHFFRGRLLIAIVMGLVLSAGWFFTGVPYWFFLGMLSGVLNIVPYLSFIGWPVAIVLKYAADAGTDNPPGLLTLVLWPSAVYIGVQLLEGWILTPWIQSGQTDLSAATVLLVVIIGGAVAGIAGMLFAIPLAACAKILLQELLLPRMRRWASVN